MPLHHKNHKKTRRTVRSHTHGSCIYQLGKFIYRWEELANFASQSKGNFNQRRNGGRTLTILNHANVRTIQRNAVGELILAEPLGLPYLTDPFTNRTQQCGRRPGPRFRCLGVCLSWLFGCHPQTLDMSCFLYLWRHILWRNYTWPKPLAAIDKRGGQPSGQCGGWPVTRDQTFRSRGGRHEFAFRSAHDAMGALQA